MQFPLRRVALPMIVLGLVHASLAQSSPPAAAHKPGAAWKQYCQPGAGFCFRYPNSWSLLGEVFDGEGVVVAPQQEQERSRWDAVTAAMVVLPPKGDEDRPNLDRVIEQTTQSLREGGQPVQTLERQARTIGHQPAQMLTLRYHEKSSARDWIEKLAFIQGPDGEIYSVALRCSPQSLDKLEPVLAEMLKSWRLQEASPAAATTEGLASQSPTGAKKIPGREASPKNPPEPR